MHLVLPMAGEGSRFVSQGFLIPKPLIKFREKPLFVNSVDSFIAQNPVESLSFIVQKKHEESSGLSAEILNWYPRANIIKLDEPTSGAAETAYLCLKNGNFNTDCVVILDSDQVFSLAALPEKARDLDFFLGTFQSDRPAYSYVSVKNELIERIVEKQVISTRAVAGIYGFKTAESFVAVYENAKSWPRASERYMSSMITLLLNEGKVGCEVPLDDHTPLGTPEELESAITQDSKIA